MIKKIIPYILILIIFIGLFSPAKKAWAEDPSGTCTYTPPGSETPTTSTTTQKKCEDAPPDGLGGTWKTMEASSTVPTNNTEFQKVINEQECGVVPGQSGTIEGCILKVFYVFYYAIPAFLLWLVAYVFNVLIYVSLSSTLLKDPFVGQAWGVVRDLSNIFFIIVLLYIAIKLILGLGGHEVKKMIAKVLIVALLINFSMFFTQVIIDSSNILALVFYNKMTTITKKADGTTITYLAISGENDIAGAMVANFDPTTTLSPEFFTQLKNVYANKTHVSTETKVPVPLLIAIILFAGSLLYYVCIVLAVAALAFLVRIIELWVLIIFSPFAFMSSTISKLAGVEYIGWEAWLKRLIKTSFMAPIFMFFLYFIFMLIKSNLFTNLIPKANMNGTDAAAIIKFLLGILLPLVFVEILLYKATKFAVSSSGKVGEMAMTGLKAAGGIALSATTGGVTSGLAMLGTKTLGRGSAWLANNESLQGRATQGGLTGLASKMLLKTGTYGQKAFFDIKNTGAFKSIEKASGMNLSRNVLGLGPKEGGFKGVGERRAAELKKESELYKTTKSNKEVQDWSKKENVINPETGKLYQSAEELNNSRLRAFRDKVLVGSNGLLGALAYSYRKKAGQIVDNKNFESDEEYKKQFAKTHGDKPVAYDGTVANEVNRKRVANTKMVIGGTAAAVLTGGVAGIAGAGAGTVAAVGATGGAIGVYASTPSAGTRKGEAKFSKELEKGIEKMSKVTDRIKENTDTITKLNETLKNHVEKNEKGEDVGLVSGDEKKGFTINTEKIERELSNLAFNEKRIYFKLDEFTKQGIGKDDERVKSLEVELGNDNSRKVELNKIKDAKKELHKLNTENLSLADKQHKLEEEQKPPADKPKGGGGGGHAPKAASHEPKHEEKHEDHPAPAAHPESGGGHDAGHGGGGEHGGH